MRYDLRVMVVSAIISTSLVSASVAQPTPQPFPRPPAAQQPPAPQTGAPPPRSGAPAPATAPQPKSVPDEASLGVSVYPNAQFIGSYDAGRGQRYYLFGVALSFLDIVAYYRNLLKNRGELVYDQPAVHVFEIGRFREETMSFPPSVTIKDYTWGGSQGYLMPLAGGKSQRFPTVIQIVPAAPGER
jgi:hypothetical protein